MGTLRETFRMAIEQQAHSDATDGYTVAAGWERVCREHRLRGGEVDEGRRVYEAARAEAAGVTPEGRPRKFLGGGVQVTAKVNERWIHCTVKSGGWDQQARTVTVETDMRVGGPVAVVPVHPDYLMV